MSIYKDFLHTYYSINHRHVFINFYLFYFVQLLYLGKLSRPKYHEFSLKLLIFFNATN